MISKVKYVFLFVICAVVFGSAMNVSAQSSGQIDKVVQYYEWLFETQFTSEQRSEYQAIKEEDFRNDPAGEKKGLDGILNNFAIIKSKNASEQERIRGVVVGKFIEDLRGLGGDNKEAKFLLSVYDDKQTADARESEAAGTGDISAYVGKWVWSHTGTGVTIGGVWAGSNGSRFTYEFSPNGDVQFTGIMNVMNGGCSQQIFQSKKGRASISENNLTINWQPGKFTRDFSCDAANNYTKTEPAKVEKMKVNFKTDLGQKQMCFLGAECFSQTK